MFIWRRWITIIALSTIIMSVSGCGGAQTSDTPLEETYWKLVKLDGKDTVTAEKQREAHLVLKAEKKRVAGSGGCNRLMGGYTLEGESLSFSQMAGTMMMCPNMDAERQFLQALALVESYTIQGEELRLLQDGKTILVFTALPQ